MKRFKVSVLTLLTVGMLASCSDDDTAIAPVNEEEVITTVTASFSPVGGGSVVTLTSRDLDGDGPQAPVVTVSGNFAANTVYNGAITFTNEMVNPAEDITAEIFAEGDHHQIFYQQNGLGTFSYTDEDEDGNPIGLTVAYTTAAIPANGTLTLTLVHHPEKTAAGVAEGNIANAGGSTDAQVSFPVIVQ
ncbi:type 1 periplasmic binding fold superfamily protein [Flavobacterium akiainvivens]|uniref:Type 1 periplasmic binding fold superfamily protein n=1 Tax=Flavobacterium akiainvivens TaxID=1202724 RepID=A0A0M8MJ97_9FLAO|nr:hypothetical protein [Flavobacterium akiainvivens]KOS07351.1 type 1 periplasmic binding fold superfamily protein [Flavobacterium akiainvivens]SFQ47022.1 hypothetical protein SAMN05444144_105154 [Flavobacterium akiainvivens]